MRITRSNQNKPEKFSQWLQYITLVRTHCRHRRRTYINIRIVKTKRFLLHRFTHRMHGSNLAFAMFRTCKINKFMVLPWYPQPHQCTALFSTISTLRMWIRSDNFFVVYLNNFTDLLHSYRQFFSSSANLFAFIYHSKQMASSFESF